MKEQDKLLIEKINRLQKAIEELEHFIYTVVEFDEKSHAIPSVNLIMKKTVETKISLLGSRYFGIGTHELSIRIPDWVRNDIIEYAENHKERLQDELNKLIN